jgi:hypothetical protein
MPITFKTGLLFTATLCATALATPAQAKWETARGYAIPVGGRCGKPHDYAPSVRATDGRPLEVPAGFDGEIEVYGHGIDFSPNVEPSGLPGLTATMPRKVGGAENGLRGCGNIGSAVVRLVINPSVAAATGTLRIGTEVVPLRIVNASISGAAWSDANRRRGRASGQSGGTGGSPIPNGPPVTSGGSPGCGPNVCPPSDNGAVAPSTSNSSSLTHYADYPSGIGECIDDFGGSAVSDVAFDRFPRTLTLTLPQARGAAQLACLTRPAIFEVRGSSAKGDIGGFEAGPSYQYPQFSRTVLAPRYSGNTSGMNGPVPLPVPDAHVQTIAMTRETAVAFVGERQITLNSTTAGASALTLVLRSSPYNGIRTIQGIPATRVGPTLTFRFDFLAAFRGPEVVAWRISAVAGAPPQTCFASVAGTLTVADVIGTLNVNATEAAGCNGSRFNLAIAPAVNGAGVFDAPFVQTAMFTLPARSLQLNFEPPQQVPVPRR